MAGKYDKVKAGMGYLSPTKRPQCGSCTRAVISFKNPDSYCETEVFRCGIGDFPTPKSAICDEYMSGVPGISGEED